VTAIHICFCMDTHTPSHGRRSKGRPRKKWLDNMATSVTTARRWPFQSTRLHNSLPTLQNGGTLCAIWAAT